MRAAILFLFVSASFNVLASKSIDQPKPYIKGTLACVVGGLKVSGAAILDSTPAISMLTSGFTYFDGWVNEDSEVNKHYFYRDSSPGGFLASFLGVFSVVPELVASGVDLASGGKLDGGAGEAYRPGRILAQTYVLTLVVKARNFDDKDSLCRQLFSENGNIDPVTIYSMDESEFSELLETDLLKRVL